jgi:hypothetical protein
MSLLNYLQRYDIPVAPSHHHHSRTGWIQLDCPFCGRDSHKFHLGFRESRGYFSCWKCGKLSLKQTLLLLFEVSWAEAGQIALEVRESLPEFEEKVVQLPGKFQAPFGVGPMGLRHRKYLQRRQFDPDEIEGTWKVQGLEAGPISWSLYIPIIFEGRAVSWTTRKIRDDVEQRYCSARPDQERIDHKRILYGWDYVQHSVLVLEGPTDVWRIGRGAVGTFGTAFKVNQVYLLSQIPRRTICFDNSDAAQQRAEELAELLSPFPGRTRIVQMDADDPGSASPREVRQLRRLAGLGRD